MIVKNAADKKYEVSPCHFFPTNRVRIVRLLNFVADNTAKRDDYYDSLMKSLIQQYVDTGICIDRLYAERRAQSRSLHEFRKEQGALQHNQRVTNAKAHNKFMMLEHAIKQIKYRQIEISSELAQMRDRKKHLKENIRVMMEVKPW